jgi:hypothetical protein
VRTRKKPQRLRNAGCLKLHFDDREVKKRRIE